MSNTKHTPGPWRIGDAGHTIFGPPNGQPAPERIADMARGEFRKANARLIASAPDLLAALVECRAIMAHNCLATDTRAAVADVMARAAIGKATGEG